MLVEFSKVERKVEQFAKAGDAPPSDFIWKPASYVFAQEGWKGLTS